MSINLIFKIAAVGILVSILSKVLKHSGRDEQAFLVSLAGLILVLTWVLPFIYELFESVSLALPRRVSYEKLLYRLQKRQKDRHSHRKDRQLAEHFDLHCDRLISGILADAR